MQTLAMMAERDILKCTIKRQLTLNVHVITVK